MKRIMAFLVALALLDPPAWGIGLAMRFVDVTMENVEPGTHINLRVARNLPLVVYNQDTENPANVIVEAVPPNPREMKDGYEPIPSPHWLQAVPNRFSLGPKASASADIILDVPNDPKLVGHHYEVILWVHTDQQRQTREGTGVMVQAGLRSRFRLSIGTMGPASLQREKALKKLATINTNFSLSPQTQFIKDIPLGKSVDLKLEKRAGLKVVNESDDPVELKIRPAAQDPNVAPEAGYEYAPDPKWISVSPEKLKVEGNSIKQLMLKVTIPDKPQYHHKRYMFLIQTSLSDDSLPLQYNNMIYIDTD